MIEIGRLAMYLRDTGALDAEGIVAAQMAVDLADTRPEVMQQVMSMARNECTWLPKTVEFRTLYARAHKRQTEIEDAARRREEAAEDERVREDRRQNPDNYIALGDVLKEQAAKLGMDLSRKPLKKLTGAPEPPDFALCQHCGKPVVTTMASFKSYTPVQLRAIADYREEWQAKQDAAARAAAEESSIDKSFEPPVAKEKTA